MKRVAVLALLAFLLLTTGAPGEAKRTGLIRVFAVTVQEVRTDDHLFVVKELRERRRGNRIGEIVQSCQLLPDGRQSCTGQFDLPLGRLVYAGIRRAARYYVLPVVGGTGVYSGSTGTLAATTISNPPRVEYQLVSLVP